MFLGVEMNRRSFLTAISALPFLGWLKPEPIPLHPTAWKGWHGRVVEEPRLTDPNDWYLTEDPEVIICSQEQYPRFKKLLEPAFSRTCTCCGDDDWRCGTCRLGGL